MAIAIFCGAAAAFGVFCALWVLFGSLLSCRSGGVVVCLAGAEESRLGLVRRCRLLRQLGLLDVPVLAAAEQPPDPAAQELYPEIEFCSPEALAARLELERKRLNGTGI